MCFRCPLRLHLDTSDYAAMYNAVDGTAPANVRGELKALVQQGLIRIGLSYHVVFELLQKAEPTYREDRLARAKLLVELCGDNALPYPTDLGSGHSFSSDRIWIPRIEVTEFEVENLLRHTKTAIGHELHLNRHERRRFTNQHYFAYWLKRDPRRLLRLPWPVPFPQFIQSGDLRRYALGEMSRDEANRRIRFYLTDPKTVYDTWFMYYGKENPIVDRRDQMDDKLTTIMHDLDDMLNKRNLLQAEINAALSQKGESALTQGAQQKLSGLRREVKQFRKELLSPEELTKNAPQWAKRFGGDAGLLSAQIYYAFHNERRQIKRSDSIDIIHAMYLPHTDLWRGDRAFSTLLINNKVNFSERIVPSLVELPRRVGALLPA
jgi:hypothetical protein